MELHEKLQELRKKKGLTQEELASALFVSRTAISKWESGRGYPSIDSLKAIAKFFCVTVDELLSGHELLTRTFATLRSGFWMHAHFCFFSCPFLRQETVRPPHCLHLSAYSST